MSREHGEALLITLTAIVAAAANKILTMLFQAPRYLSHQAPVIYLQSLDERGSLAFHTLNNSWSAQHLKEEGVGDKVSENFLG